MTLHQINQLTYNIEIEDMWFNSVQTGDKVLLIEEAILRTIHNDQTDTLKALATDKKVSLYCLQSDAIAYGIEPQIGHILSDEEWVDLTFSSQKIIAW